MKNFLRFSLFLFKSFFTLFSLYLIPINLINIKVNRNGNKENIKGSKLFNPANNCETNWYELIINVIDINIGSTYFVNILNKINIDKASIG